MPRTPRTPPAGRQPADAGLQRLYTGVLALVIGISIPVIGMQLVRAQITNGAGSSASSIPNSDDPRSCTSTGTMFQGISRPITVINLFQTRMSAVVQEREELLRHTILWQCYGGPNGIQPPPSPALEALAAELPGWHYKYTTNVGGVGTQTIMVPKPVNFESFASVIMEFEREYECKLAELQPQSPVLVRSDQDLDGPEGAANAGGSTYCCDANTLFCVDSAVPDDVTGNTPTCDGDKYSGPDPTCRQECTVKDTFGNYGLRIQNNFERMTQERIRARVAVERTVNTLRSFEQAVVFTVQMSCFQRAGLDIKNELSLMADGTSCMPKIWDSLNSLHDLKSQSPPEL
ncbi:MAG TPA: hypothetical protein PKV72_00020 [Candidatus Peribacteria bacterium]|nr:hypothetical protein [Candidatus Peribacteria bacterium]